MMAKHSADGATNREWLCLTVLPEVMTNQANHACMQTMLAVGLKLQHEA